MLPPGPRALPLLGNAPALALDPLRYLTRLTREYGDVVRFHVGRQPAVLLNDPSLIDRVVRDRRFERSPRTRSSLQSLLGPGLLTLEGAPHLRHRRLIQPAFQRERIQQYVAIMAQETCRMLARWQHGQARDLRADMMRLTLAIVARALFDTDSAEHAERIERALAPVLPSLPRAAFLSCVLPFEPARFHGPRTRAAIRSLRDLVLEILRRRRGDRGDLLSILIASRDEQGAALNDEEICAEILTLLLAGHDTTAHTLSWAWYLLSAHPELQDELAAEVRSAVGDRPIEAADLAQLQLADRVVRETMRLYPASWWSDRMWSQPSELGGFDIPANTMVAFSTYVTQRDARYFADPTRFDPARFLPERAAHIPEGAYLPFSAGVHACIGSGFALLEARLILAAIAQRFSVRALRPQAVRPKPLVTLGMADPFPVRLHRRSG
jgi:cytochrome P450